MFKRAPALLLCSILVGGASWMADDPFVGQWKLVKLTDEMKVTSVGANTYAFDFGGGPSAVETIAVDGTDQPGVAGTTLSVAPIGPNWKVVRKQSGRTLVTAHWSLSHNGDTLRDNFTAFGADGSPTTVDYVYERRAAGSGFAGTWVSTIATLNGDITLQVRAYENDGLTLITRGPSQHDTTNLTFDGTDHPGASAGSVSSARRLNARAVEIVRKANGKITQTRQMTVSANLRTLTLTVHIAGENEPRVYIFERE